MKEPSIYSDTGKDEAEKPAERNEREAAETARQLGQAQREVLKRHRKWEKRRADLAAELDWLQRNNARLKMEREILEKAVGALQPGLTNEVWRSPQELTLSTSPLRIHLSPKVVNEVLSELLYSTFEDMRVIMPGGGPEPWLETFCRLQNVSLSDIHLTFDKVSVHETLSETENALWNKLVHPAFLDIPAKYHEWLLINTLSKFIRKSTDRPLIIQKDVIAFYVNALPRAKLRRAIHEAGVTSNSLNPSGVAAILSAARLNGFLHQKAEEVSSSETRDKLPYDAIDVMEALASTSDILSRDESGGISGRETLRRCISENSHISAAVIDEMRRIRPEKILRARQVAYDLDQAAPGIAKRRGLTPVMIFNFLYDANTARQNIDPILYAWSQKFILIRNQETGVNSHEPTRLVDVWTNAPRCAHKSRHDFMVRSVLQRIDDLGLPLYCLDDLVHQLGQGPFKGDRKPPKQQLLETLQAEPDAAKQWRRDKASQQFTATPLLSALAEILGCETPEQLLPMPRASAAAPKALSVRGLAKPVPAAKILRLDQQVLLDASLDLVKDGFSEDPRGEEIRTILTRALETPQEAIDERGIPSLPHMWLMWGAFPETRNLDLHAGRAALLETWGVPPAYAPDITGTLRECFAWAGLAVMRDAGRPFRTYQDVIAAATNEVRSTQSDLPVPGFSQMLHLSEKPDLKPVDRAAAQITLRWFNALGRHGAFLGCRRPARQFVRRLVQFADRP